MTKLKDINRNKIRIMQISLLVSLSLLMIKFTAYFITSSVSILSDALESVINVVAGAFALYSVHFASKPQDREHPYGHGKIENISAGFEGALITVAGLGILFKAIWSFFYPPELKALDTGAMLAGFAGLCNLFMGFYLIRKGKQYASISMRADGKHLLTDTISSAGLIAGLLLIMYTDTAWLDNVVAGIFGIAILYTGIGLFREAVYNLLDKADLEKLQELVNVLNRNRKPEWIDIHNVRILKYGSMLHIDAHLTLPWYFSLEEAHREVKEVEKVVSENFREEMEFFIHVDPCRPASCSLCAKESCPERKHELIQRVPWTLGNILPNMAHRFP